MRGLSTGWQPFTKVAFKASRAVVLTRGSTAPFGKWDFWLGQL